MSYSILCVDDEPAVLRSLAALFRDDFETFTADSGDRALSLLSKQQIHVLISDQRMPGMQGVELLRHAAQRQPDTMRILLTGYSDLAAIVGSVNEGEVYRYINKPWDKNELLSVAREAAQIAGRIMDSGALSRPSAGSALSRDEGILVLDEDAQTYAAVSATIDGNMPVHSATTVAQAMDILEKNPIAVVVSEIKLMSGETTGFLKELKKHYPAVMTVVLTDIRDGARVVDLINGGRVFRYLPKPVRESLLKLSIERAMTRHHQQLDAPILAQREKVAVTSTELNPGILARLRTLKGRFARAAT